MFSKKATKIDRIFTVNLTVTTYVLSNLRWRFCQFLWPSQKAWTLIVLWSSQLSTSGGITRENCSTQSKSLFPDVTLCSYASWWSTLKECQTLFFLFKRSWTQSGLDIEQQHFSSGLLLSIVSIVEFKAKLIQLVNFYRIRQSNRINLSWSVNKLLHFGKR